MVFGIFELASRDDPLANRKSAKLWTSQLPANDPVGAVGSATALLESPIASPARFTLGHARALLELDRIVAPIHAQVQAQYQLATVSEDVRQHLWRSCDRLSRAFAQAYERACNALAHDASGEKTRNALHGAFTRLFHYVGVQARHGLFRYERWIPGRWMMLHQAYSEACRQGVVANAFALDPADESRSRLSPEQEYLQVLLLHRLNTGNLTAQQIDQAAGWLREWVPLLSLAIQQPEGDGFWLDLGHGDGLVAQRPEQHLGELLYLDVRPLRERLRELSERLTAQADAARATPGSADAEERVLLARRLAALWFPQAPKLPRRGERVPEQRTVTVALGWQEIALALTAEALQRNRAPKGYHYDDYGRLRANNDRAPASKDSQRPDFNEWQVHDISDSGYRIRTTAQHVARVRLGSLLALRLDDTTQWQLGIVRRLKRVNAEQIEFGIEVISRAVSLIAPKSVAARNLGYSVDGIDIGQKAHSFNALFLPGQSRARGGARPSIVLPPPEFTVGRALSLVVDGEPYEVVLAPPLERTKEWVWTPLELGDRSA